MKIVSYIQIFIESLLYLISEFSEFYHDLFKLLYNSTFNVFRNSNFDNAFIKRLKYYYYRPSSWLLAKDVSKYYKDIKDFMMFTIYFIHSSSIPNILFF